MGFWKDLFLAPVRGISWFVLDSPERAAHRLRKVRATFVNEGLWECLRLARRRFFPPSAETGLWRKHEMTPQQAEELARDFARRPLISIVTPVYKVAPVWLEKCIRSVVGQYYRNWELLLVDDGSDRPALSALMQEWAGRDQRIRLRRLERNSGIAAASNAGLEMARGDYVGFLDHDDELTPDALTWMVWAVNKHPETQWLYSDEDIISTFGESLVAHFKPDYNPFMLLSVMYTCHLSLYETSLLRRVGGFRSGFEGSQDHDLALRVSEAVPREKVVHVPRVLYHWRAISTSAASGPASKPLAGAAGRKAVEEALRRRGKKGKVIPPALHPTLYQLELVPAEFPRVSIIIPTHNGLELLRSCLDALRRHTSYPHLEIIVIDNRSDDRQLLAFLQQEEAIGRLRVLKYDKPFNHSAMNNLAVEAAGSELVMLMNNDVEMLSDHWLEQMVATVQMDDSIAGVGALLLYPDRTVQHGGIILGITGSAGHASRSMPDSELGYMGRIHCLQEFSAVTGALLLLRRSAFLKVGGFRADRYPTSYNDVDLWLRLSQNGCRCLYNPMVRAIHHEGKTRKQDVREPKFVRNLAADWGDLLQRDPFYNPNLGLDNEQFAGYRGLPACEYLEMAEPGTGKRIRPFSAPVP